MLGRLKSFVSEIRVDRFSRIAVMPEYNVTLPSRQLRSIMQILDNYNHFPEGRKLWSDRVFLDFNDGSGQRTLTEHWNGRRPRWTYLAFFALSVLAHPILEPLIAITVGDTDIGRDEKKILDAGIAINGNPLAVHR